MMSSSLGLRSLTTTTRSPAFTSPRSFISRNVLRTFSYTATNQKGHRGGGGGGGGRVCQHTINWSGVPSWSGFFLYRAYLTSMTDVRCLLSCCASA
jgi:hypothetical protein